MRKGITYYFGFDLSKEERVKLIKNAGFNMIMSSADDKYVEKNGTIEQQVEIFKNYGLEHSSLHMSYDRRSLSCFWEDCEEGDSLEKSIIKDLYYAKKYKFCCVVCHMEGKPSKIGIERVKRILKVCEELDVPIAVENLVDNSCFFQIFESLQSKHLGFCYDIGHHNIWDKDFDFLEKFGDKLIALHLHSNTGEHDEHTLNKYGNVDWERFAKKLAKCNPDISLDYELLMYKRGGETAEECVKEAYRQACELEAMVKKYRQDLN